LIVDVVLVVAVAVNVATLFTISTVVVVVGIAMAVRVSQCVETNVMQFSCSLLRIKGLYMFRALLAHL
jgi:hypothetical protein